MAGTGETPDQKPTRTIEQIEADLARDRVELAHTLDALKAEMDPRAQAAHLAEGTKAKVSAVAEEAKVRATAVAEEAKLKASAVAEEAKVRADVAAEQARSFAGDVAQGKPRALAIAGAAAAAVVGIAVVIARRGR